MEELLKAGGDVSRAKFVDASNQFYTLIPHDFGTKTPPLLDNDELVKVPRWFYELSGGKLCSRRIPEDFVLEKFLELLCSGLVQISCRMENEWLMLQTKLVMLESLLEIEVAYSLLKAGDAVLDKDPIDAHYEKLNTKIEVLDKTTDEFQMLETYVKNTHASTHTQYGLDIEEVCIFSFGGSFHSFWRNLSADLQSGAEGWKAALPAILEASEPASAVARLAGDEHGRNLESGIADCSAGSARHGLHVRQRHLLCGYGVEIGQLLRHHQEQSARSALALRRGSG